MSLFFSIYIAEEVLWEEMKEHYYIILKKHTLSVFVDLLNFFADVGRGSLNNVVCCRKCKDIGRTEYPYATTIQTCHCWTGRNEVRGRPPEPV